MWKFVNVWLAFRNSVAHFGSIGEYEKLRSRSDRHWAKVGIDEILSNKNLDEYLYQLQECTKSLLIKCILQNTEEF